KLLMMIPGPSQPEPEVLQALAEPVLPHYGKLWKPVYDDATKKLRSVFGTTRNDVILMPVPGQVAVETAVVNLVGRGGSGFVCVNGVFSGMIPQMIKAVGGKAHIIKSKPGYGPTAEEVAEALDGAGRDVAGTALFLVHTETSTGSATGPADIFRVCRKRGVLTVLDAISTFGGMEVKADEWGIDYALGYASKALGGVFGAQPVMIGDAAWAAAKENKSRIHNLFLDLNNWRRSIENDSSWGHPYPSSMPTSVIVALRKAVDLALKEGLQNRYKRHEAAARAMREGIKGLGLDLLTDSRFYSNTVTVAKVRPGASAKIRGTLIEKHGIMIADGLEALAGKIIRIGHMGTSATPEAISRTLAALSDAVPKANA
ncbi:MAG: alanine--glyoxylate aminotransferase family protein, partial [Thaumarchaeota archaeon]|nr:alanine--glyoxylate aminotransferase family protein [Nitrososphaerota archaeon]